MDQIRAQASEQPLEENIRDLVERLKQKRYRAWSTEDLVRAITIDTDQYDPSAVELMKRELDGRNISQSEREALQASSAEKSEEQTGVVARIGNERSIC